MPERTQRPALRREACRDSRTDQGSTNSVVTKRLSGSELRRCVREGGASRSRGTLLLLDGESDSHHARVSSPARNLTQVIRESSRVRRWRHTSETGITLVGIAFVLFFVLTGGLPLIWAADIAGAIGR